MGHKGDYLNSCPLCCSNNVSIIQEISSRKFIKLYRRSNIEIDYLFRGIHDITALVCNDCDLRYFYPDACGDDFFYSKTQGVHDYYSTDKFEYQAVKKYFDVNTSLLEIGAGKGAFSSLIESKGKNPGNPDLIRGRVYLIT